ncbi:MAG: hypothetical protein H7X89_02220, partial [Rhizobiales bacterium]|nr:hypothetical protein [Hyphomicrobiales bacterium]
TPALLHKCEAALILAPVTRLGDAAAAGKALSMSGLQAVDHVVIGPIHAGKARDFNLAPAHA